MMVMSWRLGARPHRLSLPIGNGCSVLRRGRLLGGRMESDPLHAPMKWLLATPSPARTPGIGASRLHAPAISAAHLAKN